MIDPVVFAAARLDEDERELKADPPHGLGYANLAARMHREVAAGRRILARHGGEHWCPEPQDCDWIVYDGGRAVTRIYPCGDLRDLLARWADHPEYNGSWNR